jgi:biotin synthase
VQSPHSFDKYWEILRAAADIFGPERFGAHLIVGMGESDHDTLTQVQTIRDLGGHSHMFAFFPERGSLMDHLPPVPRPQWRRIQLARYLIDYRDHRVDRMRFDERGQLANFGLPQDEIDEIVKAGVAFRTSGCPGREAADVSACDRPYGDSPPRDIASYPFRLKRDDIRKVRRQLDRGMPRTTAPIPEEEAP